MKRTWLLIIVLFLLSLSAVAGTGIDQVVKVVEARYAVRHHGIPGLWLAKPFLVGSGVGSLKMANFEDFHVPPEDMFRLKEDVRRALGPDWRPFIETFSKRDGEWSTIYVRDVGNSMEMLIANGEDDELNVIQLKLSQKAMHMWFEDPVEHARHEHGRRYDEDIR